MIGTKKAPVLPPSIKVAVEKAVQAAKVQAQKEESAKPKIQAQREEQSAKPKVQAQKEEESAKPQVQGQKEEESAKPKVALEPKNLKPVKKSKAVNAKPVNKVNLKVNLKAIAESKSVNSKPIQFQGIPSRVSLKAKINDPKVAAKIEQYKKQMQTQRANMLEKRLSAIAPQKLPMRVNVASLTEDDKKNLIEQLTSKGYKVTQPAARALATPLSEERARAIASRKAEKAAKVAERAKNPKNAEDAAKENAKDADLLVKEKARHVQPAEARSNPKARAFPVAKRVDTLIIE